MMVSVCKCVLSFALFLVLLSVSAKTGAGLAEEAFVQSRPVKMGDAEFSIAAPELLTAGTPAEMELRIQNQGRAKVSFPMLGTTKLEFTDAKGMSIGATGARRSSKSVPALVLNPGETKSAKFVVSVSNETDGVKVSLEDGTGFAYVTRVVKPGIVRMNLTYTNKNTGTPALKNWVGEAQTEDLEVKVSDGTKPVAPPPVPGASEEGLSTPSMLQ
jgi:hypothetical protein